MSFENRWTVSSSIANGKTLNLTKTLLCTFPVKITGIYVQKKQVEECLLWHI